MRLGKHLGLLVVAALLVNVPNAVQASLYGISSDTDSLYKIDQLTGTATFVAQLGGGGGGVNASYSGAAFLAGQLYVNDIYLGGNAMWFGSVDMTTGAFTAINDQGGSWNWHGLAADQAGGLLYTIDLNDADILKSVTFSGTITSIGTEAGIDGRGMGYDNADDILYAINRDSFGNFSLFTVNTTTGTSALIGALGINGGIYGYIGLDYDDDAGILYANTLDALYTVNVTTGVATEVGPNGVSNIDALAWISGGEAAIPGPATLSLLALGGLGLLNRRRQHKH